MSILFLDNSGSAPVTPRLPIIAIIGTAARHAQRKSAARGKKKSSLFTVNTWGTRGCRGGRELAGFHRTALAGATLHELTQIRIVTAIGFWDLFLQLGICRWCDWGIGRWRRWGIARRCLRGTF